MPIDLRNSTSERAIQKDLETGETVACMFTNSRYGWTQ